MNVEQYIYVREPVNPMLKVLGKDVVFNSLIMALCR